MAPVIRELRSQKTKKCKKHGKKLNKKKLLKTFYSFANGGKLKFKNMKDLVSKYKQKVIPQSQEAIYIIGCDAIKLQI
jgi:hypothetical protein